MQAWDGCSETTTTTTRDRTSALTRSNILTSKISQTGLKRLTENAVPAVKLNTSSPPEVLKTTESTRSALMNRNQDLFNADPCGGYFTVKQQQILHWRRLHETSSPHILRRYLDGKEPAPPGCPHGLGDGQEMHFQTLQQSCKQLRFSEHCWSPLSKSSFL